MRVGFFCTLLLGLAACAAHADMLELESCSDASGREVQVIQDTSLESLVHSGLEGGHRVIRYNPEQLPELSATVKQFFFAHECARHSLGMAPGGQHSARRIQAADCVGVATLLASGLFKDAAAVGALQSELAFSDEQWARLPGPRRAFDLTACPKQVGIALPLAIPSTPGMVDWDACVRQCGDRLFHCRGNDCQSSYDRCESACKRH